MAQDNQKYHILLLVTDGDLHDFDETRDVIVEMAHYGVSVVIVGIEHDWPENKRRKPDFSNMKALDGDEGEFCQNMSWSLLCGFSFENVSFSAAHKQHGSSSRKRHCPVC